MENHENISLKKKPAKIYFNNDNSNKNLLNQNISQEKVLLYLELQNTIKENKYNIQLIDLSKNLFLKIIPVNNQTEKHCLKAICDYNFGKEQKLGITVTLKEKAKANLVNSFKITATIGQLIGNNKNNNTFKGKIYKFQGKKESVLIKAEKKKIEEKYLIIHFKLKVVAKNNSELNDDTIYEYFKKDEYKFYFTVEKSGKRLFESEVFTDDGKFNIVQIPTKILANSDFEICFISCKNEFGRLNTNLIEITKETGSIFFFRRLSINHHFEIYNYSSIKEEITFLDYIKANLRIGLCIGIDFTESNKDPKEKDSLHCITNENERNPYERAILSCGNKLAYYDYDQEFPVYGFGAVVNSKNSDCFNINFKDDPNIKFVDNIIKCYHQCMKKIFFSGPTHFAPLINRIIDDIKKQNDPKEYQILMILTDGIIQDMQNTIDALVEGSFYPLSVIIIGIGNADFSKMIELDGDDNPLISRKGVKRQRDLVQFVPFSKFEGDEEKLTNEILEEIPRQIIEYYTLNFVYPEMLTEKMENLNKLNDSVFIKNNTIKSSQTFKEKMKKAGELFSNSSFRLYEDKKYDIKKLKSGKILNQSNYSFIDGMFKKNLKNKTKKLKNTNDNKEFKKSEFKDSISFYTYTEINSDINDDFDKMSVMTKNISEIELEKI